MFEMLFIVICCLMSSNKSIGIRKNAINLTSFEKEQILDGIYKLKSVPSIYNSSYSAYDYFVSVHIVSNDPFTTNGHSKWSFLPWHRTFLYLFEKELQRVLNNDSVYLPYWDISNKYETEILLNDITFLGGDGNDKFPYLLSNNTMLSCDDFEIDPNLNGRKWQYNYSCLSRTIGVGRIIDNDILIASQLPDTSEWNVLIEEYIPYDVSPWNTAFDNFTLQNHNNSFRSLLDGCTKWIDGIISADLTAAVKKGSCPYTLHGATHVYIGGQLASPASPNDPLFFLLHSFIDLMWAKYQDKYGDDSFPIQFGDIELFKKNQFVCHQQWTSNHVLDHREQLDYMYDVQFDEQTSNKNDNNMDEHEFDINQLTEPPLMYIWIGIASALCVICICIVICCCCIDRKSREYTTNGTEWKRNPNDYTDKYSNRIPIPQHEEDTLV